MLTMDLLPQPLKLVEKRQVRSCIIRLSSNDKIKSEKNLWIEYPSTIQLPEPTNSDSYLLAAIMPAMNLGANIYVHGSVSHTLLSNLIEFQRIWLRWCPETYQKISIKADTIRYGETPNKGVFTAFSGGLDAQFTAYRHAKNLTEDSSQAVSSGVFVHGFDIPLTDTNAFSAASEKADTTLSDIGLKLIQVRTNIREISTVNWEHYCGTALASVFGGLVELAGTFLIASGESEINLNVPWGSHPMTDPLMSSGQFQIIHDGDGYTRSEKIKLIANWKQGIKNLRVCFVGDDLSQNCGQCEKCLRTRLSFILAGEPNPSCYEAPLQSDDLNSIALPNEGARYEWRLIYDEILLTGIGKDLLPAIDKVFKRPAVRWGRILPIDSRGRKLVKKLLRKA